MGVRSVLPLFVILLTLLSGCVPVPTDEQLAGLGQYLSSRATETASAPTVTRSTATPTALATSNVITPSATVTAAPVVTPTVALAFTAAPQLSPTITATLAMSPTATATVTASPTLLPTFTRTPTLTASPQPTPPHTPTVQPTPTHTSTVQPTPTHTSTATSAPVAPTAAITVAAWTPIASSALTMTLALTATPPVATQITVTAGVTAVISSASANLRSGPGTEFDIITTVAQGRQYAVSGRNADASWWQICCVDERPAWVSASVATVQGARDQTPVRPPLLPDQLAATWAVHWLCFAEGCPKPECQGQSIAQTLQVRDGRWLELKRLATWEDKCGKNEDWLVQVDRYTGREPQATTDPPLFYIWMGANPGPEKRSIEHLGRTLSLWCTDTRTREVTQTGGWAVLFEGQACYDRGSGILVTMEYTKRWLFTGTAGGQKYERKYFGDYEVYQQILVNTNVPLSAK